MTATLGLPETPTPTINFFSDENSGWDITYVSEWNAAKTANDTSTMLCVAIHLAGTLMTEMAHNCGEEHAYIGTLEIQSLLGEDDGLPGPDFFGKLPSVVDTTNTEKAAFCDFLMIVKNSFLRVMKHRYGCMADCASNHSVYDLWADPYPGRHP